MLKNKKTVQRCMYLGVIFFWGLVPKVSAQTDTLTNEQKNPVYESQEVIITATKSKLRPEEVPQPVAIITKDEVERRYQYNVGEMLDALPGVRIIRSGSTIGASYGLSIRSLNGGPSSDKTLVLVDGRPVNDAWSGGLNFNMLPSELVERVEVVKGASSALYGSRATAGVVNVITRNPQPGWHSWVSIAREFNSSETIDESTAEGYGRPDVAGTNLQFNSSYGGEDTRHFLALGYRSAEETFINSENQNNWDDFDASYKLGKDFSENLKSDLFVNFHTNTWKDEADRVPSEKDYQYLSLDAHLNYTLPVGVLDTRFFLNNADYDERSLQSDVETGYNAWRYGMISDYTLALFNREALLKVGVDVTIDDAQSQDEQTVVDMAYQGVKSVDGKEVDFYTGTYGNNKQNNNLWNLAFFTQYEQKFMERMNVVLGARVDRHSEFGTVFNPKIGSTFDLYRSEGYTTTLKLNYGKGFRSPTIQGLFSKSLGGYGNINLKPEKTEDFDIGLFQRFADWGSLEISYFTMNVTDLIVNDKLGSTGDGYIVAVPGTSGTDTLTFNFRKNLGSYSPSGVEVGLTLKPHKQLTLKGAYTYLDPEDFTFQTSKHRYNFSVYGWHRLSDVRLEAELAYNYTGDGYFFDYETRPYEAFSTIDLMVAAQFLEQYRLSLVAKNLGDTTYQLWHYEWQPGRTVTLRLETKF